MSELVVVSYPDESRAEEVLGILTRLERDYLVDLDDACYVTRSTDGKVRLHQRVGTTAADATRGALWGTLIGLIFLSPLLGMVHGGGRGDGDGAVAGKLADVGIADAFIRELGHDLRPGSSAIFVLVRHATADRVLPDIAPYGGTVLRTSLSADADERLTNALAGAAV